MRKEAVKTLVFPVINNSAKITMTKFDDGTRAWIFDEQPNNTAHHTTFYINIREVTKLLSKSQLAEAVLS